MRTRSSGPVVEPSTTPRRRRNKKHSQQVDPTIVEKPVVTMADTRTMAELLQAPTEGYGDAIVIPAILAENFELKHGLLNLVTSKQFCGFEKEDPHAHIRWFNKITSTIKYKDQRFDESFCEAWQRFKDLLHVYPHHDFTELHQIDTFYNSLTSTDQDSLNAAAGGNRLTKTPKDALTLIENKSKVCTSRNRPIVAKVSTNTFTSGLSPDVAALTDAVKALLLKNTTPPPASVKADEESCVTCGGPHPYYQCLAMDGNASGYQDNIQAYVSAAAVNYNQGNTGHRPPSVAPQAMMLQQNNNLENMLSNYFKMDKPPSSGPLPSNTVANPKGDLKAITTRSGVSYDGPPIPPPFSSTPKAMEREPKPVNAPKPKPNLPYPSRLNNQKLRERDDHQMIKFLQIFRSLHFDLSFTDALLYMPKSASTFKNLLSNKEKLFKLANTPVNENCSAVILKKLPEKLGDLGKFLIPCNFPEIVECLALADLGASINLMPLSIWRKLSLPELTPTQMILELTYRSTTKPTGIAEDVFVRVGKFHFLADFVVVDYVVDPRVPLILGRPFLRTARALIDVYACEEYSQKVLGFSDNSESGNPTPISKLIIVISSLSLTPFEGDDFILEEIEACFASDSVPPGINDVEFDPEGDIRLIEEMLNKDTYSPHPPKDLKCEELKSVKSSVDEPPELELNDLPSRLEYAFLEGINKLPVIIAKNLKDEEKERLIKVLKSYNQAIAWKLSDIKVQHQRRVNPKIHEVVKNEVVKLLDVGLIYPISDSPWVSPVHCVPKKDGMTVVTNEDNELIPTRLVTGWCVCIDYRKLNDATSNDQDSKSKGSKRLEGCKFLFSLHLFPINKSL
ncbi:reverse transcriptase domain-containing protein [Tanacetum coccineum]